MYKRQGYIVETSAAAWNEMDAIAGTEKSAHPRTKPLYRNEPKSPSVPKKTRTAGRGSPREATDVGVELRGASEAELKGVAVCRDCD